jgi:predicted RNase H-like HicB family nuclease
MVRGILRRGAWRQRAGKTREECLANLREAITLILEYRREESLRALPPDASREFVVVG